MHIDQYNINTIHTDDPKHKWQRFFVLYSISICIIYQWYYIYIYNKKTTGQSTESIHKQNAEGFDFPGFQVFEFQLLSLQFWNLEQTVPLIIEKVESWRFPGFRFQLLCVLFHTCLSYYVVSSLIQVPGSPLPCRWNVKVKVGRKTRSRIQRPPGKMEGLTSTRCSRNFLTSRRFASGDSAESIAVVLFCLRVIVSAMWANEIDR